VFRIDSVVSINLVLHDFSRVLPWKEERMLRLSEYFCLCYEGPEYDPGHCPLHLQGTRWYFERALGLRSGRNSFEFRHGYWLIYRGFWQTITVEYLRNFSCSSQSSSGVICHKTIQSILYYGNLFLRKYYEFLTGLTTQTSLWNSPHSMYGSAFISYIVAEEWSRS
jgi:hypothetical protein